MPRPDWIEVGRVARAHGLHGEVRVASSSDNPERFVEGAVMWAMPGRVGLRRGPGEPAAERFELEVESVRGTWESPIVAFVGVETREDAEALRGHVLQVPADDLPELEDGEFYPFDLEGLQAQTAAGDVVGEVKEVLETPAHDLLAITLATGGELLVPFTFEFVPDVQVEAGYLVVETERLTPES